MELKQKKITLVMSPSINLALGSPIHRKNGIPTPVSKGGLQEIIPSLDQHPFFTLMHEHHLPIALATDNPNMGGVEFKVMLNQLAGLTSTGNFSYTTSLTAEELVMCCLNAIM